MKIHADDCPALTSAGCDGTVDDMGVRSICYHTSGHSCTCHAQQALDELVAAAQEASYYQESTDSHDRLQAALKPFLPNA